LFDFSIYHNRWSELEQQDFAVSYSPEKGADSRNNVAVPVETVCIDTGEKEEIDSISVQYLRKAIEDCQKRGIDVLLTYLPFPGATQGQQKNANWIADLADEYGIDYLNYYTFYELLDFETDCYDSNSHLNASGARKVTDYIGNYISTHYDIPDQRENTAYSGWYEDYEEYTNMKLDNMKKQTALLTELMMMQDEHFSYALCVNTSEKYFDNHIFIKLLENIGVNIEDIPADEQILIMVDHLADTVSIQKMNETLETSFGTLYFDCDQEGSYMVFNDHTKLLDMSAEDSDMGWIVFSHETKTAELSSTASDYAVKLQ
jgi:hypothetical protein